MVKPISRTDLYNLVWSEPMTHIAKKYGLSDRGMAKLCERNGIPVPPRGYWAKHSSGKKIPRAPLLSFSDKDLNNEIRIRQTPPPTLIAPNTTPSLPADIQDAIDREHLSENRITVPTTVRDLHPIVSRWKNEADQERAYDKKYGREWRLPITPLDQRRWKLTSCLLKALEDRGYKVVEERNSAYHSETWITCAEDQVGFSITEKIRQYRRELTAAEKADLLYATQKFTQVREATGMLEITLTPKTSHYSKTKIQEDKTTPFEDRLNEIIIKVIEKMWTDRSQRLANREAEHQRWQKEQERYERQKAAEREEKYILNLEYKAQSWKRAQAIREYVDAVTSACTCGDLIVDTDDFNRWKKWALDHANQVDFITNGNPLINLAVEPEDIIPYKPPRYGSDSTTPTSAHYPRQQWYQR